MTLDVVIRGDCVEELARLPEACVDCVFADPPYNLQLSQELWRPNMTKVDAVDDDWDRFGSFEEYDEFSEAWLSACRRVLKPTGTIWVIGTYHNIFRIGTIMQDLGYWILNDVIWIKSNPMPNFRGVRFTNAHETLIWACRQKGAKYTFNHHAMRGLNDDRQMRSDWVLPICSGRERLKVEGTKAHSTQKPEALLYRVILASTKPGDLVLDPFFGSGTTGVVAKKLHRHYLGIERDPGYVRVAEERLDATPTGLFVPEVFDVSDRRRFAPRVPFAALLEAGMLQPGQMLYFRRNREMAAQIRADGKLIRNGAVGSIHQVGRELSNGSPCNGWEHWYYEDDEGELVVIDDLRQRLLAAPPSDGTR